MFDRIRAEYVDVPDERELMRAAINGMLSSLDPHSTYLDPDAYEETKVDTTGEFGGLGIQVTMEEGRHQGRLPHRRHPGRQGRHPAQRPHRRTRRQAGLRHDPR